METLEPTLGQLVISAPALRALQRHPLPAAVSFRLDDIVQRITPELESYDAALARLAQRYCAKIRQSADGCPQYEFPALHRAIVKREVEQLLETKIHIAYEPLQRADIGSTIITPADVRALAWLFAPSVDVADAGSDRNGEAAFASSSKKSTPTGTPVATSGRRAAPRGTAK